MSRRELALAAALTAAATCIVRGVSMWTTPGAWIAAGILLAALAILFLTEVVG